MGNGLWDYGEASVSDSQAVGIIKRAKGTYLLGFTYKWLDSVGSVRFRFQKFLFNPGGKET